MFWNASAIKGYHIAATDGDVGHIADILVDEANWAVRWLVVHTGSWLQERAVCLPAWSLARPDPDAHDLAVTLTRRQIETSPEIDENRMPSPAQEATIGQHYAASDGLDAEPAFGTLGALVRTEPVRVEGSQRLVSLNVLTNATVEALDGEIGHVESLLVDPGDWTVKYLVVHTGHWWAGKKVLILPGTVARIDHLRSSIELNVNREKVRGSPDFFTEDTVDGAFDEQFHIYYGIKWMKK